MVGLYGRDGGSTILMQNDSAESALSGHVVVVISGFNSFCSHVACRCKVESIFCSFVQYLASAINDAWCVISLRFLNSLCCVVLRCLC